jgi:hypothetical protein
MKTIKQLFMLIALMCTATSAWADKEAYVVITENNDDPIMTDPMSGYSETAKTMTFYYDENKALALEPNIH